MRPYLFKLIALGDGTTGKTSLVKRYTEGTFQHDYKATIGATFALKHLDFEMDNGSSAKAKVVVWDIAGQPSFREMRSRYMEGASMAFIVFDVTRPDTFLNVANWYGALMKKSPDCIVAAVANKIDLTERAVPSEVGGVLENWIDVIYVETSALTGENVDHMFSELVKRAVQRFGPEN
ncbi:MAG: GTP-binding protein [Candidatus Thorarchaeota archaeon]|nr:MAG: GTP-binding protein [Candidatus Thorarchaeota archaeon]